MGSLDLEHVSCPPRPHHPQLCSWGGYMMLSNYFCIWEDRQLMKVNTCCQPQTAIILHTLAGGLQPFCPLSASPCPTRSKERDSDNSERAAGLLTCPLLWEGPNRVKKREDWAFDWGGGAMEEGLPARKRTAQTSMHPLLLHSAKRFQPGPGYLSLPLHRGCCISEKGSKAGEVTH